jgi:hypothetical protein
MSGKANRCRPSPAPHVNQITLAGVPNKTLYFKLAEPQSILIDVVKAE